MPAAPQHNYILVTPTAANAGVRAAEFICYVFIGVIVMENQMKEYRDHLVLSKKEAQRDFDKTVFALSGGAIGVSFAFITDIGFASLPNNFLEHLGC
jgi:hypothetical protein